MSATHEKRYVSAEILKALALRHSKDVFIPECKDGPTQSVSRYLRMDAWAMNKSWAHPVAVGYEIKVTRSDFLQDNKWPGYLPLCNQFYFVAPAGLIQPTELSAEVGLMTISGKGNGARLLTKKKAAHRDIELPESLYRYILMCRVIVGDPHSASLESNADRWRRWLADKSENKKLGYEVSKAIRDRARELEIENARLKQENANLASVEAMLESMDLSSHHWNLQQEVKDRLTANRQVCNPHLIRALKQAQRELETVLKIAANLDTPELKQTA